MQSSGSAHDLSVAVRRSAAHRCTSAIHAFGNPATQIKPDSECECLPPLAPVGDKQAYYIKCPHSACGWLPLPAASVPQNAYASSSDTRVRSRSTSASKASLVMLPGFGPGPISTPCPPRLLDTDP